MDHAESIHRDLARRLREVREEFYGDGEDGLGAISGALGVPAWTWANFESGVVVPGVFLLRFIEATGAHPIWLLSGMGERYLEGGPNAPERG
jgi:hypothetical protein